MTEKTGSELAADFALEILLPQVNQYGYVYSSNERRMQAAQVLAILDLADAVRALKEKP